MKIKIVNDSGLGTSTRMFNAETDEELSMVGVKAIHVHITGKGPITMDLEYYHKTGPINITAELDTSSPPLGFTSIKSTYDMDMVESFFSTYPDLKERIDCWKIEYQAAQAEKARKQTLDGA